MAKILVVEDNPDYQELLRNFLENAGYEIITANDGEQAVLLAEENSFDMILLDLMLPKINGYEVCHILRTKSNVPIIMLTALDSEQHQMKGYNLKTDDYITKPVSMPLLIHKIEAVLRRTMPEAPDLLQFHGISLNIKSHTIDIQGRNVEFTLREFEILYELMKNPGVVVTRTSLLNKLWSYDFYGDTRIVDTHIKNIRRKLADNDCIETVRGVGYKLKEKV